MAPIYAAGHKLDALAIGEARVRRAYAGDTKVFEAYLDHVHVALVDFSFANVADGNDRIYEGIDIGLPALDRIVLLGPSGRSADSGGTITGAFLNGDPCTELIKATAGGGSESLMAGLFALRVPSGIRAADIRVGYSVATNARDLAVYRMRGRTAPAVFASANNLSGGSVSLNIPAKGAAVGIARFRVSGGGTYTWTGLDEDYDSVEGQANNPVSGASRMFGEAISGHAIVATASHGSPAVQMVLAASFAPGD